MGDVFHRNLVILIFVVAYMYMNFISLQIRTRSGWSNLTCNPLNLFTHSLFQSQEEANHEFQRCVVNLSSATTRNLFEIQKQDQERVLANMTGIQKEYTDLTDAVNHYVSDASNITQDYTNQITALEESQVKANQLNAAASTGVKNYLSSLTEIVNDISNYFKKK